MSLYENALGIYNSNISLHGGTTFSHRYKAILAQIRKIIRRIGGADKLPVVAALEGELDKLDAARKKLEDKLLAIYPGIGDVLKALMDGSRKDIAVIFGNYDAETDGVGIPMLNNMLGLQGSEAIAVLRVKELIRKA